MGYVRTEGIVIKEINFGEADKIITVLSKEHGKISLVAKGARRYKSKLAAGTQFLCYSKFLLFKGRNLYTINGCELIESFQEVGNDLVKLTYAAHLAELVYDTAQENQPSARTLKLFLNALYYLVKTNRSSELITKIFELRYLCILGYAPYVKGCINCMNESPENLAFSFKKCGFVCCNEKCMSEDDKDAIKLSSAAAKAIRHIVQSNINVLFNFELSEPILKEVTTVIDKFLREMLEKDYTKLKFLKDIK